MNRYTRDIMAVLKVDAEIATQVQYLMECNGIDYSECTFREFKMCALEAYAELRK